MHAVKSQLKKKFRKSRQKYLDEYMVCKNYKDDLDGFS